MFRLLFILFTILLTGYGNSLFAQQPASDSTETTDLVISYSISISNGKKKTSVADMYDGGSKTFFLSRNQARIRLVSLMRIESIFFLPAADSSTMVYQVKESGRKPNRLSFTETAWRTYNNKYDSARSELVAADTKEIMGYPCKKAILHLADGRTLSCYYTDRLPPLPSLYDPAFSHLPGLVLEYSYSYKGGTATYTAISFKYDKISPGIFLLQGKHPADMKL
jgi:GLPGLI family protein